MDGEEVPEKPLISPVTDPSPEVAAILADSLKLSMPGGKAVNVFATFAKHPPLLERFNAWRGLGRGTLPDRDREVVILRTAWRTKCIYEFGHHTLRGKQAGLNVVEVRAIAGGSYAWSPRDLALIAVSDELNDAAAVSPTTWVALRAVYDEPQAMEVIFLAGFYRMLGGFLNSVGVEREPGVPGWP